MSGEQDDQNEARPQETQWPVVHTFQGNVLMGFPGPPYWIQSTPALARSLARRLQQQADIAESQLPAVQKH